MPLPSASFRALACFFLLAFFSYKAPAQYNDLKNDPSVTWMAEFTSDHDFSLTVDDAKEVVKLIKFYDEPTSTNDTNIDSWVTRWLFRNAMDGHYDCYNDPGLTQKLSEKDLGNLTSTRDTIITFYPETMEEVIQVVKNELSPAQITRLRINQVIYYNRKTGNFLTRIIAIAPLFKPEGNVPVRPLFWIKMNEAFSAGFNIHSPEITWGALAYSRSNPLAFNFLEVVKNTENINFNDLIYQQALEMTKPIESPEGFGCNKFLTKIEIEHIYNSVDTVITFYPETMEEVVQIVKNDLNPNEISQYRLVQEWYYDRKKRQLMNRLRAIAPLMDIHDAEGAFKYSKALYYIGYE